MSVFVIVLAEPNAEVTSQIFERYPDAHQYNRSLYLVEADAIAENVATAVKIKGDDRIEDASGFVLKLEEFSYSGYTSRALWDWLKEADKKS